MYGLCIQIVSFFFLAIIIIAYFSKKKVSTAETKIFSLLLIVNFIGVIIDIASTSIAFLMPNFILLVPISKLYLLYLIAVGMTYTFYTVYIAFDIIDIKKLVKRFLILFLVFSIICLTLPLYTHYENNYFYTYGPSATFAKICGMLSYAVMLFIIVFRIKHVALKKCIPLLGLILFGITAAIVQILIPQLLIMTFAILFVTVIMYFTIENPDVKMIEQLNMAKDTAEKANRAKTDFLSNMSHEIRTPLNAIVGFSQALKEENLPSNAVEEVNDILMSANSLLDIVNGILDISKIEANKLEIVNVEYNSNKLMKDIISLITARIGDKPLEFKTYIDESIPAVLFGDHVRIKQIIVNLLTNAVKYTKEGHIDFKVSTVIHDDNCRMIVSVEDTGIGIKSEDMNKLFTKFERLELEKNITTEGTGLGLAITKSLVELMGGKIVVQSVYGKGSKFTVAIDQKIIPKTLEEAGLNYEVEDMIEPFNATGSRILVVDDNRINLKVAARLLKDYNISTDLVTSGQECIDNILNGEKYDLILMDDMMPKMTGTQTLQNLKNIIGFDIPVIALTANAITGMKEKYIAAGFNDYLAKPIDRNKLHSILKKYLKETNKTVEIIEDQAEILEESVSNRNVEFLKEQGVDVDHGLELLGDMETYDMTLEEFIEESKTRLPKIEEYRLAKDMPNYAILVHAMKSDCKYLGFMTLADLSYQHELASKENNIDFVEEHYDELMNEVGKVLTIVKKYFGK